MKKTAKLTALLLALVMALSLAACSGTNLDSADPNESKASGQRGRLDRSEAGRRAAARPEGQAGTEGKRPSGLTALQRDKNRAAAPTHILRNFLRLALTPAR